MKVIGARYMVENKIGSGGMGEVFLGRDINLDRLVAIKILYRQDRGPESVDRLEREAKIQAKVSSHPNIVTIFDSVIDGDNVAIVMEYVEGETLEHLISAKLLGNDQCVEIFRQVLHAVSHAHANSVIHRDLKPSNVMVQKHEGRFYAKVMDFGIAKLVGGSNPGLTKAGYGTPEYMSPEQIKTPRAIDYRSDIFSLGVMLYEILTGRRPFEGKAVINDILTEPPRPFSPLSEISVFEPIVLKALQKEPAARFRDCLSFLKALDGVIATGSVPGPPSPRQSPETFRSQLPHSPIIKQVVPTQEDLSVRAPSPNALESRASSRTSSERKNTVDPYGNISLSDPGRANYQRSPDGYSYSSEMTIWGYGGICLLLFLVLPAVLFALLFFPLDGWEKFSSPDHEFAAFYHYLIIAYVKSVGTSLWYSLTWTWRTFGRPGSTPFGNLNIVLGIISVLCALILWVVTPLAAFGIICRFLARIRVNLSKVVFSSLSLFIFPAVLFVIYHIVAWLFLR